MMKEKHGKRLVGTARIELATSSMSTRRSNRTELRSYIPGRERNDTQSESTINSRLKCLGPLFNEGRGRQVRFGTLLGLFRIVEKIS